MPVEMHTDYAIGMALQCGYALAGVPIPYLDGVC